MTIDNIFCSCMTVNFSPIKMSVASMAKKASVSRTWVASNIAIRKKYACRCFALNKDLYTTYYKRF